MVDLTWQKQALCRNSNPDWYDLDWVTQFHGNDFRRQDEYAKTICAGCPVIKECAKDALETIDVSDYACTPDGLSGMCWTEGVVRAGLALRAATNKNRGLWRKRLARVAGVEFEVGSWRPRRFGSCVVCGEGFSDVVSGGVYRRSARVCVGCHVVKVPA